MNVYVAASLECLHVRMRLSRQSCVCGAVCVLGALGGRGVCVCMCGWVRVVPPVHVCAHGGVSLSLGERP